MKGMMLILALLFIFAPVRLSSATIFAIGSVEPRLTWRHLAELPAEVDFFRTDDRWIDHLKFRMARGERIIVAVWGPDTIRVIGELTEEDATPPWLVAVNPGCIKLPRKLQIVKFPRLFDMVFPLVGRWWIGEFVKFAFAPRNPPETIINSYIYYWSRDPPRLSSWFLCRERLSRDYRGNTLIFKTTDRVDMAPVERRLLRKITITLSEGGLFPQEAIPFYVNGIMNAIIKRRMR